MMISTALRFTLIVSLFMLVYMYTMVNTKNRSAASFDADKEAKVQKMRRMMRYVDERRSKGYKSSYDDELAEIRVNGDDTTAEEEEEEKEEAEWMKRDDLVIPIQKKTTPNVGQPIIDDMNITLVRT